MTTTRSHSDRFSLGRPARLGGLGRPGGLGRLGRLVASLALGMALLTGCGAQGASTDCGIDACVVTFDRGVNAEVSVLGVRARLVGVDGDQATVEVAGERASLTLGQQPTQVGGLYFSLDRATESQVAIRISRNPT